MKSAIVVVCALGGIVTWAAPARAQDEEVRREIEALRREVEDLRRWKTEMEDRDSEAASSEASRGETGEVKPETGSPFPIDLPRSFKLSISGELRPRFEYRSHVYTPSDPEGDKGYDTTHMRTRLRFDFEVEKDIRGIVELQDVRVWGEEGSTTADTEGVDLKRGEMILSNLFDEPLSLEVGRFVLAYGDHRLIGDLEWFDQGRTFDGVRVSVTPENAFVDLFGTRVRDDAEGNVPEEDLVGVYGGIHELLPTITGEAYALLFRNQLRAQGEEGLGTTGFITVGTRLDGKAAGFDYTGELALQSGEVRDDDLLAWACAVKGGYTFEETDWTPRVGVEVDYASGDDDPTDGDNGTFQTLFPTNHKHYGYADLAAWSNLLALKGGVSAKPVKDVFVSLDYYHFRLADSAGGWYNAGGALIRPGDEDASSDLGDEIDLLVEWKAAKCLSLLAGWSHFFPGSFVKDTGDDPQTDFFYVQMHLKF